MLSQAGGPCSWGTWTTTPATRSSTDSSTSTAGTSASTCSQVIDIIVERLQKESNLYKRVDLFFIVDSITQCSCNQKAGDIYPTLIQAVLPRLPYAAAPPRNSAWENRRHCLKVLKLCLERKTFPEYIIRHQIRELEAVSEASFGSSRCP